MEPVMENVIQIWPEIKNIFSVPQSDDDYNRLVSFLDSLIDEVGENEEHPLASLMDTIGNLIEAYEVKHLPEMGGTPVDALAYLMQEHGVRQGDLPEIGSQGVVSEILNGKRRLNTRQVKALGERFGVSPVVFI